MSLILKRLICVILFILIDPFELASHAVFNYYHFQ